MARQYKPLDAQAARRRVMAARIARNQPTFGEAMREVWSEIHRAVEGDLYWSRWVIGGIITTYAMAELVRDTLEEYGYRVVIREQGRGELMVTWDHVEIP